VTAARRDPQPATEALVDRLLASPRYGEQWGRRWLDVIRFGESNGFERNFVIDDLWPFRDYVIRSLNDDKPFDQFIVEHLAGDVLGRGRPEVEVGSAFLVAGPYDDVGNQDRGRAEEHPRRDARRHDHGHKRGLPRPRRSTARAATTISSTPSRPRIITACGPRSKARSTDVARS
jgi:hypothetical protein